MTANAGPWGLVHGLLEACLLGNLKSGAPMSCSWAVRQTERGGLECFLRVAVPPTGWDGDEDGLRKAAHEANALLALVPARGPVPAHAPTLQWRPQPAHAMLAARQTMVRTAARAAEEFARLEPENENPQNG